MQYNVEVQVLQNTHDGQAWHHFVAMELNRKAGVYDQCASSVTDSIP